MSELTTLNVYAAADNGLLSYCRRTRLRSRMLAFFALGLDSEPSLVSQSGKLRIDSLLREASIFAKATT
jgi:hypothetical protein